MMRWRQQHRNKLNGISGGRVSNSLAPILFASVAAPSHHNAVKRLFIRTQTRNYTLKLTHSIFSISEKTDDRRKCMLERERVWQTCRSFEFSGATMMRLMLMAHHTPDHARLNPLSMRPADGIMKNRDKRIKYSNAGAVSAFFLSPVQSLPDCC